MKKILRKVVLSKLAICVTIMSNVLNVSAMNAPKSRFEHFHLLNVASYMPEQSLVNLAMVNKKCQETLFMMHRATIDDSGINTQPTHEQKRTLLEFKALNFKQLNSQIHTLDICGDLKNCLYIASREKDIDPKKISTIALYERCCDIFDIRKLLELLNFYGFTNVKSIEIHNIPGEYLYRMLYDSGIIMCKDIDVDSLKRTPDGRGIYIEGSNIQFHIESVDLSYTEDKHKEYLRQIFKNTCFYIGDMVYHEDFKNKHADDAIKVIIIPERDEDENDWDWEEILNLVSEQYDKRLLPFVYIETQSGFDKITVEYLESKGLIVRDKNGNVIEIKWDGSLNPIRELPILLNTLTRGDYNCEYDANYSVVINGLQQIDPKTRIAIHNANALIILYEGKHYVVSGTYIPAYATPHPSFWDQYFDYSNSLIHIGYGVGCDALEMIPRDIYGRLNFLWDIDENEKTQICDTFNTTRELNNIKIIEALGYDAQDKIKEKDLCCSTVQVNFPDVKANKVDPKHHAICEHTETEFCKEQIPSVKYHSKVAEPIFTYHLTLEMLELRVFGPNNLTITTHYVYTPTFKLTGVSEAVYKDPNTRLVIHPKVRVIYLQPRAEGRLTFVLPPNIDYIKKEFWQPGNLYILPVWMYGTTLNYLKSIKDEHEIEISDSPDKFGFWNIRKKDPFTINRNPVFQMN